MRTVSLAALQFSCSWTRDDNIAKADRLVRQAARQGGQVILLPELFETPYFCAVQNSNYYDLAHPVSGHPTVAHFRRLAAELGTVIAVSVYERAGMALFNSAVMIDADGEVAGHYRKSHIPQAPGYEEKYYFSPGDTGFKPFATAYGKLGLAICWDQWFPEAARALVLQGAEFLMYPTAIGTEPNDSSLDSIADHLGALAVAADRTSEQVLVRAFDLERCAAYRQSWGCFRDRRPDLYGALLSLDGDGRPAQIRQ